MSHDAWNGCMHRSASRHHTSFASICVAVFKYVSMCSNILKHLPIDLLAKSF
jgi:hypothetical protein